MADVLDGDMISSFIDKINDKYGVSKYDSLHTQNDSIVSSTIVGLSELLGILNERDTKLGDRVRDLECSVYPYATFINMVKMGIRNYGGAVNVYKKAITDNQAYITTLQGFTDTPTISESIEGYMKYGTTVSGNDKYDIINNFYSVNSQEMSVGDITCSSEQTLPCLENIKGLINRIIMQLTIINIHDGDIQVLKKSTSLIKTLDTAHLTKERCLIIGLALTVTLFILIHGVDDCWLGEYIEDYA